LSIKTITLDRDYGTGRFDLAQCQTAHPVY
jgi:hypothetical protein